MRSYVRRGERPRCEKCGRLASNNVKRRTECKRCPKVYQTWYRQKVPEYRKENLRRTNARHRALSRLSEMYPEDYQKLLNRELRRRNG